MTRTDDWLKYSEELLEIADILMNNGRFSWSCFTINQAAAAALKSILSKLDESTFGDNLIALLRIIKEQLDVPDEVKNACHNLNEHFTKTRDLENRLDSTPSIHYTLNDAKQAKNDALIIIRFAHRHSH
ncbi:MAG: HEPN domain-containing protein [Asgard group archaeon]|nr:HEPN domain-containing protein [Asgard group archaeon]